jgi:hypothetical protein
MMATSFENDPFFKYTIFFCTDFTFSVEQDEPAVHGGRRAGGSDNRGLAGGPGGRGPGAANAAPRTLHLLRYNNYLYLTFICLYLTNIRFLPTNK